MAITYSSSGKCISRFPYTVGTYYYQFVLRVLTVYVYRKCCLFIDGNLITKCMCVHIPTYVCVYV